MAGRGCVSASTRIYDPTTGQHTRVDQLEREGASITVLALTPDGPKPATALAPFRKGKALLYQVTLENGYAVQVTDEHRFLTPGGWQYLRFLREGNLLAYAASILWSRIESIVPLQEEDYYDLTVPEYENYLAEGIWHHNTGKTRASAEWVRGKVESGEAKRIALVGATAADTRDTMVLGESGLIAVSRPDFTPTYEPSKRRVIWPNGAIATLYSADKPRQLRGPQHDLAWGDEVAAWTKPDALDQLMFGLRLGINPQVIFSTTPARVPHLKRLMSLKHTVITRGTTYDNLHNLAPTFREQIVGRYEGTRLGNQELLGKMLEDVEGALWQSAWIEEHRFGKFLDDQDPERDLEAELLNSFTHITIALDPTTKQKGDACGIVVVGKKKNGHLYVVEDATAHKSPKGWAELAVAVYRTWEPFAPVVRLVAEANQGGEMITEVISHIDDHPPVRLVYASKGKHIRAEPIAEMYEKGRVHHVGSLAYLEEELCLSGDSLIRTSLGLKRLDKVSTQDYVWTRQGWRSVRWAGMTAATAQTQTIGFSNGSSLVATASHPIYTKRAGFVKVKDLQVGDVLEEDPWVNTVNQLSGRELNGTSIRTAIIKTGAEDSYTGNFLLLLVVLYLAIKIFTTRMKIASTTPWTTLKRLLGKNTTQNTLSQELQSQVQNGAEPILVNNGKTPLLEQETVPSAAPVSPLLARERDFVPRNAAACTITSLSTNEQETPVFNLIVDGEPEYYANGVLVHNCSWVPGDASPNRLDALVWACTDLAGPQKKGGFYRPDNERETVVEEIEIAPGTSLITVRARAIQPQEIRWHDGFLRLPGREESEDSPTEEDDESVSGLWG